MSDNDSINWTHNKLDFSKGGVLPAKDSYSIPPKGVLSPIQEFIEDRPSISDLVKQGSGKKNEGRCESDPHGIHQNAPGAKLDAGKLMGWLFLSGFANALEDVAKVTTVGATKYTKNGWVLVQDGKNRYMDAFMRHAFAYGQGEIMDDGPNGTGCTHISQMIWNLLAAHELDIREKKKNGQIH